MIASVAGSESHAGGAAMRRRSMRRALAVVSCLIAAMPARAADLPLGLRSSITPTYHWDGAYFGAHVGFVRGTSDYSLGGFPDHSFDGVQIPATTSTSGFIGGFQGGYQRQMGALVLGFESDVMFGAVSGSVNGSGALDGFPYGTTESQEIHWLTTLRGRIGFAASDEILVYGTGGLAVGDVKTSTDVSFTTGAIYANSRDDLRAGWVAGAGVEYALSQDFSVTLEYLHFALGDVTVVGMPNGAVPFESHTTVGLGGDIVRAGLNYRLDNDLVAFERDVVPFMPQFARTHEDEIGVRYWYSTGKTTKNLFDNTGSIQVSRLTYDGLNASAGEAFGRLQKSNGLFAKGFVGAGVIGAGNLKDEDFPPAIDPYSATTSAQRNGNLIYFVGDVGYDVWRAPAYRLGAFVGVFYDREHFAAYGCTQTAGNPDVCTGGISDQTLVIEDDARWLAARVGLSGQLTLWNCLRLDADVAWLPYVTLANTDTHWLRSQPIPGNFAGPIAEDGVGHTGVQVEGIVSYLVSPSFSVGVGGRYWRMETDGTTHFENSIVDELALPQANSFAFQRYGGFVQGALKF